VLLIKLPPKEKNMSVSGIASHSSIPYNLQTPQTGQIGRQVQQEFQQIGQDLQSGNLSAAQSDLTTFEQLTPQSSSTSSTQSNSPTALEFNQLSQDLQSGNLSAAQQDYSSLQQSFQSQAAQTHHYHHHHGGGSGSSTEINQLFDQLGQELQAGNLSTAQQTYSALQDFQGNGLLSGQSTQSAGSISAIA
jgi:outer membrane protein assembly factor BamD (BamD/ComL family)